MINFDRFDSFNKQRIVGKAITQTPFGEVYEAAYDENKAKRTTLLHATPISAEDAEFNVSVRLKKVIWCASDLRDNDRNINAIGAESVLPVLKAECYPDSKGASVLVVTIVENAECLGNLQQVDKRTAVDICMQLCMRLDELHKRGIVHGAVCPATVFLSNKKVRLICAGYSAILHGRYADNPYITSGADRVTVQSDIYSTAMIFRSLMLFGRCVPDPHSTSKSSLLSDEIDKIIAVVMNKACLGKPESRYKSIEELRDKIREVGDIIQQEERTTAAIQQKAKEERLSSAMEDRYDLMGDAGRQPSADEESGAMRCKTEELKERPNQAAGVNNKETNRIESSEGTHYNLDSIKTVSQQKKTEPENSILPQCGETTFAKAEDSTPEHDKPAVDPQDKKKTKAPIIIAIIVAVHAVIAAILMKTPAINSVKAFVDSLGFWDSWHAMNSIFEIDTTTLPSPYIDPTVSPSPYIDSTVSPSLDIEPTASPSPYIEPTASPSPYIEPTASPSPYIEPTASPSPDADPIAVFSNSVFEKKLRTAANLSGTIHMSDLLGIKTLKLNECGLSDISEIAMLKNLEVFYAIHNSISDISALALLPDLKEVHLRGNNIEDISALAELTRLTFVGLSENRISDLSPLEKLTNVTELHLHDNNISDISPLASLTKLVRLSLYNNSIQSLLPLSAMTEMKDLQAYANRITSSAGLENMTMLETLKLNENEITDLGALCNMTHLKVLCLGTNNIYDLSPLSRLYDLEELHLKRNNIYDVSALAELKKLRYLALYENYISDASPLYGLTELETLKLQGNNIPQDQKSKLHDLLPNCVITF